MITQKELQYVNAWEKKAPYPGDKYARETLVLIKEMYTKYNDEYKGKVYNIIFSDATEFDFSIYDFNLCHLLGIDYKNLTNGTFNNFLFNVLGFESNEKISAYQLITRIIENSEDVIKYDASQRLRILNYYKSRIKCSIFEKISEFDNFNFGKLETDDDTSLLYMPSNEAVCPYFFMRIGKGDYTTTNIVKSLIAPQKEEIKEFFNDKKAVIPTQIIIDDNKDLKKTEATAEEKIKMLNMYKLIMAEYGVNNKMDISGDYIATLTELNGYQKKK